MAKRLRFKQVPPHCYRTRADWVKFTRKIVVVLEKNWAAVPDVVKSCFTFWEQAMVRRLLHGRGSAKANYTHIASIVSSFYTNFPQELQHRLILADPHLHSPA